MAELKLKVTILVSILPDVYNGKTMLTGSTLSMSILENVMTVSEGELPAHWREELPYV